jgi:hypothetical protein
VLGELAPGDDARQRELLGRVARFALRKHPKEPRW